MYKLIHNPSNQRQLLMWFTLSRTLTKCILYIHTSIHRHLGMNVYMIHATHVPTILPAMKTFPSIKH
jgi:hypothetical protein